MAERHRHEWLVQLDTIREEQIQWNPGGFERLDDSTSYTLRLWPPLDRTVRLTGALVEAIRAVVWREVELGAAYDHEQRPDGSLVHATFHLSRRPPSPKIWLRLLYHLNKGDVAEAISQRAADV